MSGEAAGVLALPARRGARTTREVAFLSPTWHFGKPSLPWSAVALSFAALALPLVASAGGGLPAAGIEALLWLPALIPAFLLAYYRGWRGAATALAAGMSVLAVGEAALVATDLRLQNWPVLLTALAAYVALCLSIGVVTELLHRERARAEMLALMDDLTGLANRRQARLWLEREFARAQRGHTLTLVFFDLDQFKQFNDRHGHARGDLALREFAQLLAQKTRRMDMSSRYGGEEFLSVLAPCGVDGALSFANRVRAALASHAIDGEFLTVSVGIAMYDPSMTDVAELLRAADEALYLAKTAGRDCVRVAEPGITVDRGVPAGG